MMLRSHSSINAKLSLASFCALVLLLSSMKVRSPLSQPSFLLSSFFITTAGLGDRDGSGGTASPQPPGRLTIPELNLCLATVRQAKCLQTFWNLTKCQTRLVSHHLYRAFFITLLQPAIAWRRSSSLPLLSIQCLGDIAPSLRRTALSSAASPPVYFPFSPSSGFCVLRCQLD